MIAVGHGAFAPFPAIDLPASGLILELRLLPVLALADVPVEMIHLALVFGHGTQYGVSSSPASGPVSSSGALALAPLARSYSRTMQVELPFFIEGRTI